MRVDLSFELPDELDKELQAAAQKSGITPSKWSAMVIEAELATRRLDYIEPGRCGPQFCKD